MPPIVRSQVPRRSRYTDYREELRHDFLYLCAYCTISEVEAKGLGFEIDHYRPRAHFPDLSSTYDNLLWTCANCNRNKADVCPGIAGVPDVLYFVRPDVHDPSDHIEEADDHSVVPTTESGRFTIDVIGLNRTYLREVRALRVRAAAAQRRTQDALSTVVSARIDAAPQRLRTSLIRLRSAATRAARDEATALRQEIRELARSFVLDPDVNSEELRARRRRYLRAAPAVDDPPPMAPRRARKRRRKRSA